MIIALASLRPAASIEDGLERAGRLIAEAAERGAEIVCFPEAYLPGLRGQDFEVPAFDETDHDRVLNATAKFAKKHRIAVIMGTEQERRIVSVVFDSAGRCLGRQTKNQIDPSEDRFYVPGSGRTLFEINGVKFGITICHEGWRYPETVRWAAMRGAKIVFHPQHTGNELGGTRLAEWAARGAPYYEQAMMMRSRENTIWFASVNYALKFAESATAIIDPSGECFAHLSYGGEGVLVADLDMERATGLLASRFAPDRHE
jgi:predicted amidohydrolase